VPSLQVVPPFYDHPAFINAFAEVARPRLDRLDPELVFFSFHGLPERQIEKGDPTGVHCLKTDNCCETPGPGSQNCYRAHCVATARLLADRLGLPEEKRRLCFQSRLGRAVWIGPATDELLKKEAQAGRRRAAILSPAFVADCLETVEELGIRGLETWREHGGETLELIPCPNSSDTWADAVVTIARENGLPAGARSGGVLS
jgi:ferrochelatase